MALFDIRSGKKITEDFHFNINHQSMIQLFNRENEIVSQKLIEVATDCKVTLDWISKQKQVIKIFNLCVTNTFVITKMLSYIIVIILLYKINK